MDNGLMSALMKKNLDTALEPVKIILEDSFSAWLSGRQTLSLIAQAQWVTQAVLALWEWVVAWDFAQELQWFVEELKLQNSWNTLPRNERWKKEEFSEALSILHRCRQILWNLSKLYWNEPRSDIKDNIASIWIGVDWFWKSLWHIRFEEFKKKIIFFLGRINVFKDELDASVEYQKTSVLWIGRARKEIQESLTQEALEKEQTRLKTAEKEALQQQRETERIRTMREALFLNWKHEWWLLDQRTIERRTHALEWLVRSFTTDQTLWVSFDDTGIVAIHQKAILPEDKVAVNDEEFLRKWIDLLKQHSSNTLRIELETRRMRLQSQVGSIKNFSEIPDPMNSEVLLIGNEENVRLIPYITSGDYIYAKLLNLDWTEQRCKFKKDEFSLYNTITLLTLNREKWEWDSKAIHPIAIRYKEQNVDTLVNQPEPEIPADKNQAKEADLPESSIQETGTPIQSEETQPQRNNTWIWWFSKMKLWFWKAA